MEPQPLAAPTGVRIGELSRRTGVSDHLLRAWERRYSLLSPARTPGGFRVYSTADEQRVRGMRALMDDGLSAAQAAQRVLHGFDGSGDRRLSAQRAASVRRLLHGAVRRLDEAGGRRILDDVADEVGVESTLMSVVMPLLRALGDGWQRGTTSIAQEHFASHLVRERIAAWSATAARPATGAPTALLACPAEEHHDLGLLVLSALLRRRGWSVRYLGADTPASDLVEVARATQPAATVLSATRSQPFADAATTLVQLHDACSVVILAGAGATPEVARAIDARATHEDPRGLADRLTRAVLGS